MLEHHTRCSKLCQIINFGDNMDLHRWRAISIKTWTFRPKTRSFAECKSAMLLAKKSNNFDKQLLRNQRNNFFKMQKLVLEGYDFDKTNIISHRKPIFLWTLSIHYQYSAYYECLLSWRNLKNNEKNLAFVCWDFCDNNNIYYRLLMLMICIGFREKYFL